MCQYCKEPFGCLLWKNVMQAIHDQHTPHWIAGRGRMLSLYKNQPS